MVKSAVSWVEPLLVEPGPVMLEYDEETRRLDLCFDPSSRVRTIVLPRRDTAVPVGHLDIGPRGIFCRSCQNPIRKAVGLVTLTWEDTITCESCFWDLRAKYRYDPAYLRRSEAARRGQEKRYERERRDREAAYAAERRPQLVTGARR